MLEWVLYKRWRLNIKYCKKSKNLPEFLTQDEVRKLISVIQNRKHKLLISMCYAAGFRVSELVKLRVRDLELDLEYGWVRHGKGDKDRAFVLAVRLMDELKDFIKDLDKNSYIFTGYNKSHLSVRSVQEIVKKAAKVAGIEKNVHPHTLRHSFATHVAEKKHSLLEIAGLLGHSRTDTSMQYIHNAAPKIISIRSPYDDLEI